MDFLIVIPAYAESQRLLHTVRDLAEAFAPQTWTLNIQVVDDGSPFEEQEAERGLIESLRPVYPMIQPLMILPRQRGKGAAIRAGWSKLGSAEAQWLVFVDADGAVPATEVVRLCARAQQERGEGKAYFASRIRMLGRSVQRSAWRHYLGRIFATLVGQWISPQVYDSQCGCKLVPTTVYRKIEPWLQENGFVFDVELLAALQAMGTPIEEVPVDWRDVPGSKVHVLRDSWRMAQGVWRIRRRRGLIAETLVKKT